MEYAVIDKVSKELLGMYPTFQDAWAAWQNCWMGRDVRYPIRYHSERFSVGKFKNIKRRLK